LLNLVEKDLNKNSNNKDGNSSGNVKVVIPLNKEDVEKITLNNSNKTEEKKNKHEKENKEQVNNENSKIFLF